MGQQVAAHSHEIVGGEGHFFEPIFERRIFRVSRRSLQEHALVRRGYKVTRLSRRVLRTFGGEAENIRIKLAGFRDIANIDGYVIDAEDERPLRLFLAARGKPSALQNHAEEKKNDCVPQSADNFGRTLHDVRDYISQAASQMGRVFFDNMPERRNIVIAAGS
jgi:hypothetical protein